MVSEKKVQPRKKSSSMVSFFYRPKNSLETEYIFLRVKHLLCCGCYLGTTEGLIRILVLFEDEPLLWIHGISLCIVLACGNIFQ